MNRVYFMLGAALGGLAVAAGAYGAHKLGRYPENAAAAIYETGVRYHFIHALALLAVSRAMEAWPGMAARFSGICMTAGIILFSGSLYLHAAVGVKWVARLTPVGGLLLICGWLLLAAAPFRSRRINSFQRKPKPNRKIP